MKLRVSIIAVLLLIFLITLSATAQPEKKRAPSKWKAGLARVIITPDKPVWMAGYAARNKPADGKIHDLQAKALALQDAGGNRLVIVTTDLLGFPRTLAEDIAAQAQKRYRLRREQLLLTSSHTHTGPVLRHSLRGAYQLSAGHIADIETYTEKLQQQIVTLIGNALRDLKPAVFSFGRGEAGFAVNRRQSGPDGMRIGVNQQGPVDRDVPLLRVSDRHGKLRGVLFGYACHNTTLTGEFYQYSGDYAGFAQYEIEKNHPGAMAMYLMGCGADANPYPRSALDVAVRHGHELAQSVEQVLNGEMTLISGTLKSAFARESLSLTTPSREEFQSRLNDKDVYRQGHAQRMLARLDRDGRLPAEYPYPIQVAQLGSGMTLIALGGEVVVDYSLRLRKELGAQGLWIAGYSNDVMAYIPSVRILREGGYEADSSMLFYDLPGPWHESLEEKIISRVHQLVTQCGRKIEKP